MIDQSVIQTLRSDFDDVLLGSVVALFLQQTPSCIAKIRSSLEQKNEKLLQLESHSLKSSSASLGALAVSKLCANIEAYALEIDASAGLLKGWVEQLESEYALAASELNLLCG